MRKRLLLLCFTLSSLCAYAFALDDGNYLVRNVVTGKYWGAANSWGTRASLVSNPEYVTFKRLENGKYHLESQVNNGETAYYFNGDYMDNDSPVELAIEQQTNGYYTIGNGKIFYGYDGSTTVLGKTETNASAPNVQWEIISVENAIAALAHATPEHPMNATFLIADANFGRNNRHYNQWSFEASNQNNEGDVSNYCVESWHSTFDMNQIVSVPNGIYSLTAQGFYRQDGSDETHLPVFYINDATRTFLPINGSENSMSDASASFSKGLYYSSPIYSTVTDGSITVGARLEENSALWCIWDNFTLLYYGTEASMSQLIFNNRFNSIVAKAGELQSSVNITINGQKKLSDAITAYNGIDETSSETTQLSVEEQLSAAICYVEQGEILIEKLSEIYTCYEEKLNAVSTDDNNLKSLLTEIGIAISSNTLESNEKIEEFISSLSEARQQYYPYEYRYWFDNDESTSKTDLSTLPNWSFNADLSNLGETFHSLHIQVFDKDNIPSSPITKFFIKTIDSNAIRGQYWFDDDISNIKSSPQAQGFFDIDVSQLNEGFHIIHYQLVGTKGTISQTASKSFYKMYIPSMSSWRCWFDNDYSTVQTGTDMSKILLLDVTQLTDGYHILHIQVDGGAQSTSTPITKPFVKIPQTIGVDYLTCLCMIDNQIYKQEKVSSEGGIIHWQFDVSSLPHGFHRMQIQVITPTGATTSTYDAYFLRTTTAEEMADMKCVYAIDGNEFNTEAGQLANGTYHFDLDVSHLDDGLHRLTYMLSNGSGISTKAQTQFFTKIPLGGNGITEYWYWLNDQADSNAKKVTLSKRQNPFSLISLLPVESQPIRSSLFQFRMEQDKPMLYAKNDFHIRFYDASGRFTDVTKQFVDENVKQEVTDITLLESGIRATTAKPEENTIKWYCLQAEPGDSLQFKLDRAATIQLFSPSGEEVYSASGSESVKWGGCHSEESGTFYVALHDVTATYGNDISIDYNHIDKYAVLRQDVSVVGNGGCSTITFEGNGFYNLKDVTLTNDNNSEIKAANIEYISDSEVAVLFNFEKLTIGVYDACFNFGDESRTLSDAVTVEKADSIKLKLKVENASQFLRGGTVTYTLKISNLGNSTAYRVPLEIQLYTSDKVAISFAEFSNNIPKLDVDWMDSTIIEKDSIAALKAYIAQQGDLMHFMSAYDSISNRFIKDCHLAIDIAPKSTYFITLSLISDETIELQAVIPSKWIFYSYKGGSEQLLSKALRSGVKENMCCVREKVECVMNVLVGTLDFLSIIGGPQLDIADCIASLGNTTLQYAYDVWCGESNGGKNPRKAAEDLAWDAVNGLIGCICNIIDIDKLNIQWIYQHIYNNIKTTMDCVTALTQKIPNCPPTPDPSGGSSTPVNSFDPNDIYGYTTESGSKAIKDEQTDVYYTIQFENDTAFATAAAHDIYLTDTLDVTKFDLSTFAPTRVKIGDKSAELTGDKDFVTTVDMRPEINAIAQVEGTFDEKNGIAKWHISSLDPMTMEPTDDPMDGVLPVNYSGNGIGEVSYDIKLKSDLAHGTEVNNRAGIVFDQNETIMTPTWTNIIDRIAPESHIADVQMLNDSTATVNIEATDELSGPWRYDVYVQYGPDAPWWKMAENVPIDTVASVKVYEGIDHGFYVVVTDSAGNVEQKDAAREFTLEVFGSQVETNTQVALSEGWNWMSHNQNTALPIDVLKPSAIRMVGQTEETIKDARFGWTGDLDELLPTQMYKLQMAESANVQLEGLLFNAAFRSIPLYEGWNWIGYPVANVMTPAEAFAKLEAEEGDFLIGQDGMATYSDGQWVGTLTEMQPGKGYMYRSMSYKNLFYNASAQSSSRAAFASRTRNTSSDEWSVNKHKYPNVMAIVASLSQDDEIGNAEDCVIAAFCGDECRGIAKAVDGVLMMNVYGNGKESINFYAMNRDTEEILKAKEEEDFKMDVLGTMNSPYELHFGKVTGITEQNGNDRTGSRISSVYDMQGRRINVKLSSISDQLKKGIYIVTDENNRTKKIVGR